MSKSDGDDDENIQPKAFAVNDKKWSDEMIAKRIRSGNPPASADEYLARVRYESKQMPNVVRVEGNFNSKRDTQVKSNTKEANLKPYFVVNSLPDTPIELLPDEEWCRRLVASFSDLRQYICRWRDRGIPNSRNENKLNTNNNFSHDHALPILPNGDIDSVSWKTFCSSQAPTIHILVKFKQTEVRTFLEHISDWLKDNPFGTSHLLWIFALMSVLEKPLLAESFKLFPKTPMQNTTKTIETCTSQQNEISHEIFRSYSVLSVVDPEVQVSVVFVVFCIGVLGNNLGASALNTKTSACFEQIRCQCIRLRLKHDVKTKKAALDTIITLVEQYFEL